MKKNQTIKDSFHQNLELEDFSALQDDRSLLSGLLLYACLIIVSMILFFIFYIENRTAFFSTNVPLLKDIRPDSSIDYQNYPLTDAALSNDGSTLFVSRHEAGILDVTSRNFRLKDDIPGPFADGSFDRNVLDIAVTTDDRLIALGEDRLRVSGKSQREWVEIIGGGKVPGFKRENIKKVASDGDDLIFLLDNRSGWCIYERDLRKLDPLQLAPALDIKNNENVEDFEIVSSGSGLLLTSFNSEQSDLNGFWNFERDGNVIQRKPRHFDTQFGYPTKLVRGDLGLFVLTDKGAVFEIGDLNDSQKDVLLVGGNSFNGFNTADILWLQPSLNRKYLWCLQKDGHIGKYELSTRSWRSLNPLESGFDRGAIDNPVVVNDGQDILVANASGSLELVGNDSSSNTRLILKAEEISGSKRIQSMGDLPDIGKIWFIAKNSKEAGRLNHEELFLVNKSSVEELTETFSKKPDHVWSYFSDEQDPSDRFDWDMSIYRPQKEQVELISSNGLVYPYSLKNRYFGLIGSQYQIPNNLQITSIANTGNSNQLGIDLFSLTDGSVWEFSSVGIDRQGTRRFPLVSEKSEFLQDLDFQLLGLDYQKQIFLRSDGYLTSYDRSQGYSNLLSDISFEKPLKLNESNVLMKKKGQGSDYFILDMQNTFAGNPEVLNVGEFQEVYQSPTGFGYKKSDYEYGVELLPFGKNSIQRNVTVERESVRIGDRISRCEVIFDHMVIADERGILVYNPIKREYSRPIEESGELSWDYVGLWNNSYGLFYSRIKNSLFAVNPVSGENKIIESVVSPVLVNGNIFAIQDGNLLRIDFDENRRLFPTKNNSISQINSYRDADVAGDHIWLLSDAGALIEYHFEAGSRVHSSAPQFSQIFTNQTAIVGLNGNGDFWISDISKTHSDLAWRQIQFSNPGFSNQKVSEIRKGTRQGSFLVRTSNGALWFLDKNIEPICIAGGKSKQSTGKMEWVSIDDEGVWFIDNKMQLCRWVIESRSLLAGRHDVEGFISWLPYMRRGQTSIGLWTANGIYFMNDQFEKDSVIDERIYSLSQIRRNIFGSIEKDFWVNIETGNPVGSRSGTAFGDIKNVNSIGTGYILQLADKIAFHNPKSFGNSVQDIFEIDSPSNIYQFGEFESILSHGKELFTLSTATPRKIASDVLRFDCGNNRGISLFDDNAASLLSGSMQWTPVLGERNAADKSTLVQAVQNKKNQTQIFLLSENGNTYLYDSSTHYAKGLLGGVSRVYDIDIGVYAQTDANKLYELGNKAQLVFESPGIKHVSPDGIVSGIDQSVPWSGSLRSQRSDLWDVKIGAWPDRIDRIKPKPNNGGTLSVSGFNEDQNRVILTEYDISTGRYKQIKGFDIVPGDQCLRIISASNGNPLALSTSGNRSTEKYVTFNEENPVALLNFESGPFQSANEINFIDTSEVWNVKNINNRRMNAVNLKSGILTNKRWQWGVNLGENFWLHALNNVLVSGVKGNRPVLNNLATGANSFKPKYLRRNLSKNEYYIFDDECKEILFVDRLGESLFIRVPNKVFGVYENAVLSRSDTEIKAYEISENSFSNEYTPSVLFQSPRYPASVVYQLQNKDTEFYLHLDGSLKTRRIELPFRRLRNIYDLPENHETVSVSKVVDDKVELYFEVPVEKRSTAPEVEPNEELIGDISLLLNNPEFKKDFFLHDSKYFETEINGDLSLDLLLLKIVKKGDSSFLIRSGEGPVQVPVDQLLEKWSADISRDYVIFKNDLRLKRHLQDLTLLYSDIEGQDLGRLLFVSIDEEKSTKETREIFRNISNGRFGVSIDLNSLIVDVLPTPYSIRELSFSSKTNLALADLSVINKYGEIKSCYVVDQGVVVTLYGFENKTFMYTGDQKWGFQGNSINEFEKLEFSDVLESPSFLRPFFRPNYLDVYGDKDWVLSLQDGRFQRERFNALGEVEGVCFARSADGRWWDRNLREVQQSVDIYNYIYPKEFEADNWTWVHNLNRKSFSVSNEGWSANVRDQVISNGSKPIWDYPRDVISIDRKTYVLCGKYLWIHENGRRQLIQAGVDPDSSFGWFEGESGDVFAGIFNGNSSYRLRGSGLVPTSFQDKQIFRFENTDFSVDQLVFSSSKAELYPNVATNIELSDGSLTFSSFLGDCFEHEFPDIVEERDGEIYMHCGSRFSLKVDRRGQFDVLEYQGEIPNRKEQKVKSRNDPLCSYSLIDGQYFCLMNEGKSGFSGALSLKNGTFSYEFPKFYDFNNGYLVGLDSESVFYRSYSNPENFEYSRGLPFALSEVQDFKADSSLDAWVLSKGNTVFRYEKKSDRWVSSEDLGPFTREKYRCQNVSRVSSLVSVVVGEEIDFQFTGMDLSDDPQFEYLSESGNFSRFILSSDSNRQSMVGTNNRSLWFCQDGEVSVSGDQWTPVVVKLGSIPQWPDPILPTTSTGLGVVKDFSNESREVCWISGEEVRPIRGGLRDGLVSIHMCTSLAKSDNLLLVATNSGLLFSGEEVSTNGSTNLRPVLFPVAMDLSQTSSSYKHGFARTNSNTVVNISGLGEYFELGSGSVWKPVELENYTEIEESYRFNEGRLKHYSWNRGGELYSFELLIQNSPSIPIPFREGHFEFDLPVSIRPLSTGVLLEISGNDNSKDLLLVDEKFEKLPYRIHETMNNPYTLRNGYQFTGDNQGLYLGMESNNEVMFLVEGDKPGNHSWVKFGNQDLIDSQVVLDYPYIVEKNVANAQIKWPDGWVGTLAAIDPSSPLPKIAYLHDIVNDLQFENIEEQSFVALATQGGVVIRNPTDFSWVNGLHDLGFRSISQIHSHGKEITFRKSSDKAWYAANGDIVVGAEDGVIVLAETPYVRFDETVSEFRVHRIDDNGNLRTATTNDEAVFPLKWDRSSGVISEAGRVVRYTENYWEMFNDAADTLIVGPYNSRLSGDFSQKRRSHASTESSLLTSKNLEFHVNVTGLIEKKPTVFATRNINLNLGLSGSQTSMSFEGIEGDSVVRIGGPSLDRGIQLAYQPKGSSRSDQKNISSDLSGFPWDVVSDHEVHESKLFLLNDRFVEIGQDNSNSVLSSLPEAETVAGYEFLKVQSTDELNVSLYLKSDSGEFFQFQKSNSDWSLGNPQSYVLANWDSGFISRTGNDLVYHDSVLGVIEAVSSDLKEEIFFKDGFAWDHVIDLEKDYLKSAYPFPQVLDNNRYRVTNKDLERFDDPLFWNPGLKSDLQFGDYSIEAGNVITNNSSSLLIDGVEVYRPSKGSLFLEDSVGKLWIVSEDEIRWIRLENRWIERLIIE